MRSADPDHEPKAVLAGPRPHAIAHRGSRVLWPENTMTAFAAAVDLGFEWLETDLHLTRDGVLVCLHDDILDRTTTARGFVWDRDLADLDEVDAGAVPLLDGERPFLGSGVRVPTLEELATTFPDVRLVLDLKQDGLEEPLTAVIGRLGLWERVMVGSFDDARLERFRALTGGRVATSTGSAETRTVWQRAWVGTPPALADALQVPRYHRGLPLVTRLTVRGFHRAGYHVHVWTVNRPAEMTHLLEVGVDGIITDRPDLLKKVLVERGTWSGR